MKIQGTPVRKTGNPEPSLITCDVCGRVLKHPVKTHDMILCDKHYHQFRSHGKFLDNNPRTIYDPNEIRIDGDVAYVDLYDKYGNTVATVIIDAEDVERIRYDKWRLSITGYANYTTRKKGTLMMHRKILGTDQCVDHINGNKLDNRKSNLRIATKSQNSMNVNYRGISEHPTGKFSARIKINQKLIYLGTYELEVEALFARWYAEVLLFKEFRYPKEKPQISLERETDIMSYVERKVQRL